MNTERKDRSFGVKFGLALFVAIFCYLMVMTIAGPILVDKIGAAHTRIAAISITFVLVWVFVYLLRNKNEPIRKMNPDINGFGGGKPRRRYRLLCFAVMAFLMTPFGFAGVLESRGGGYLPPLWGGGLCLASGIILISLYLKKRN